MTMDELLEQPCTWFVDHDPSEIAISSRIRLARNMRSFPFPVNATAEQRLEFSKQMLRDLRKVDSFKNGLFQLIDDLEPAEKALLYERSLISKDLAADCGQSAVAISPDQMDVVMVNEEDHLRIQVVRPGLSLQDVWQEINAVDDAIEVNHAYAFSDELGYLTCCPTNTGTGMRAGVMLHLPGLVLLEEIRPVIRGLGKLGLAVRGSGGEGSDADGFLYQISNQITLGQSEEEVIQSIGELVEELIEHEKNARLRLEQSNPVGLRDRVGRAMGILQNARVLTSKEALDQLALVRLGLSLGLLELDLAHWVEQLMVEVRPAHLQKLAGRELTPEQRDSYRADWVRSKLADLKKGRKL